MEEQSETFRGKESGAYVIVFSPQGVVFVEKPGKGRGYELPGGHGEETDESFEECGERELAEETGIQVPPEDLRMIGVPQKRGRHNSATFLAQIPRLPKTLKKENVEKGGRVTEVIHVLTLKQLNEERHKIWPPHLSSINDAFKTLGIKLSE